MLPKSQGLTQHSIYSFLLPHKSLNFLYATTTTHGFFNKAS